MLVALYARVSKATKEGEEDKTQNVDTQLYPLREFVKGRGWKVYREYTEEISAVKQRPQLDSMMADAFQRKFDIVVVWAVDRIARSIGDFTKIVDKLTSYGVGFMATSQSIDTRSEDPTAKAMRQILGIFAELERSMIIGRVKAGISRAKAQGVRFGREPEPFDATKASKLLIGGMSLRKVAKEMGVKKSFLYARVSKFRGVSGVYAVRFNRSGLIKIGSCNNIYNRVLGLQAQKTDTLEILAFVPEQYLENRAKREELAIHASLSPSSRYSGREWYVPSIEVQEVIFRLRAKTPKEFLGITDIEVRSLLGKYITDPLDTKINEEALDECRRKLG